MDLKNIAIVVALIGAVNWGLAKFVNFDLVSQLLGKYSQWGYGAVAIAGIYSLYSMYKK